MKTPLSWAAEKRHEAAVKLLLEKGTELDFEGRELVSGAAAVGDTDRACQMR